MIKNVNVKDSYLFLVLKFFLFFLFLKKNLYEESCFIIYNTFLGYFFNFFFFHFIYLFYFTL